MKKKPDLQHDRASFLAGGEAAALEKPMPPPARAETSAAGSSSFRITKTIRMDKSVDLALKRAALERSAEGGSRVTESDLIQDAIKIYLNL